MRPVAVKSCLASGYLSVVAIPRTVGRGMDNVSLECLALDKGWKE